MEADYSTAKPPREVNKIAVNLILDKEHISVFDRALSNVLATEIAEKTLGQIVDGIPLSSVAFSIRGRRDTIRDPVYKHEALCDGVLDRLHSFRDEFSPSKLQLEHHALHRFQCEAVGSQASNMALVELVARAVHEIAVLLYKLDDSFHKGQDLVGTPPPVEDSDDEDDDEVKFSFPPIELRPPFATPFTLLRYSDPEQYTEGTAELPGYWAEDQIFGGVVLFQRERNGAYESDEIWYHSSRETVTQRVYALTDEQKKSLLDFLRGFNVSTPLPILGDDKNRKRVDQEVAMPEHGIFRDRWERKVTVKSHQHYLEIRKDVKEALDYPEFQARLDVDEIRAAHAIERELREGSDAESTEARRV